jgi:iron complex transport system substrate-binding protein
VGLTEYCNYPAETKIKTKVGGFSGATVSTESIVALKPDLVLVSGDMHEKISALLEKLGIRVFAMEPRTFEDVYKNILAVGLLTGHSLEAALIVENMKTRLNAVSTRIAGRKPKAVFWELWDDPLMTAGGAIFVNQAITAAGGKNIFADMSETWPTVSLEELLSRDADWILAGNDHGNRANFTLISKRTGWSKLTAVRMGQIATVESDKIFRGGPRLVEAVEEIERILR